MQRLREGIGCWLFRRHHWHIEGYTYGWANICCERCGTIAPAAGMLLYLYDDLIRHRMNYYWM